MLQTMDKISRPQFDLHQEIVVTPSEHSTWQPFKGKIVERRHLHHKGWWYRVVDFSAARSTLWVPEANLALPAATV